MMDTNKVNKSRLSVYAVIGAFFASGMTNSILSADGSNSSSLTVRVIVSTLVALVAFLLIVSIFRQR